ncbi:HNH endonuclease signature motif containing protein [Mycolicibacterium sp. XJ2]
MFEVAGGGELLDTMRDAQRAERVAVARKFLAAGRFALQRFAAMGNTHDNWCVDDWDVIASEIAAELGISRGRASSMIGYGRTLIEHMPRLGEVFLAGQVDFRVISIIDYRAGLIVDDEAIAAIDEMVAHKAPSWNKLSDKKIAQLVDWMVLDVDPDALRVAKERDDDRYIDITIDKYGMADIEGKIRATDAAALDETLSQLTATVCRDDPRTARQRRADALMALVNRETSMACRCETQRCAAAVRRTATTDVVIHLIADAATVSGEKNTPGYVAGVGPVPAPMVRDLARTAKLKPLVIPKDPVADPRYRPSAALADFVRCRDLTCRWPGCDKPAWKADIDHTVPYPAGPTHPSNNACYCRFHHLMKTFHCGPGGWTEQQSPDGTIVFTSPSGRTYLTEPLGAQLFTHLATPTGVLTSSTGPPPNEWRGLAMPKRKRTRAQDRAYRINRLRAINAARYAADIPPF